MIATAASVVGGMFGYAIGALLYESIGEFARRNINLVKVESRPSKQSLGEYIFLIDCSGHRQDPLVGEAIESLRASVDMLRVLGSYPRWTQ